MKQIKCPACGEKFTKLDGLHDHIEEEHSELIPEGYTAQRFIYYNKTGKTHGSCVICKKDTEWNETTGKYKRFCNNPKCKEEYREIFKQRMTGKYGKTTLLNEPEQQKKMLAHRHISGEYKWTDGTFKTYTGSYELDFLRFLDLFMNMDSDDVITPSPHTYYYIYEGEKKFYIPDVYIPSLNLEIEIKDGGNNPNMHGKIQAVDKVKEKLKDEVLNTTKGIDYIKIVNKEYDAFFEYLVKKKDEVAGAKNVRISGVMENTIVTEGSFDYKKACMNAPIEESEELNRILYNAYENGSIGVATDWHLFEYDEDTHTVYRSKRTMHTIDAINNMVDNNDVLIYLGDLVSDECQNKEELRRLLQSIKCTKILIKGNNDLFSDEFYKSCGFIYVGYKFVWEDILFSHMPVENDYLMNVHGHIHGSKEYWIKYTNQIDAYREDGLPYNINDLVRGFKEYSRTVTVKSDYDKVNTVTESATGDEFYFYHLIPDTVKLDKYGLISPDYMYKHNMMDLYMKSVDKYRNRLCSGWNIYPNKRPEGLTPDEIYNGINKFRKSMDGNNQIYFFKYPPYKELGPRMADILSHKRVVRININNPRVKKYIKDIDWGWDGSNTDNRKLNRSYYENISYADYFKKYNDNASMNFAMLNHISITPKNGYLPLEILDIAEPGETFLESATIDNSNYEPVMEVSNISKDNDNYYDFERFVNGDSNILLITGLEASNTTKVAREYTELFNAEYINLDLFTTTSINNILDGDNKGTASSWYINQIQTFAQSKLTMDPENRNHILKPTREQTVAFIKTLFGNLSASKKYVIEGIAFYRYEELDFITMEYPLIVKHDSLKSTLNNYKTQSYLNIFTILYDEILDKKESKNWFKNEKDKLNEFSRRTLEYRSDIKHMRYEKGVYPVYVVLMHSGSGLATAIKKVTGDEFTHASISFDPTLRNMYSFGKKYDSDIMEMGLIREDANSAFLHRPIDFALYVTFVDADEFKAMKHTFYEVLKREKELRYSFIGLVKYALGMDAETKNRMFCSEFVAHVLNSKYNNTDGYYSSQVRPEDFKSFENFKLVQRGKLSDYDPSVTIARVSRMKKPTK